MKTNTRCYIILQNTGTKKTKSQWAECVLWTFPIVPQAHCSKNCYFDHTLLSLATQTHLTFLNNSADD